MSWYTIEPARTVILRLEDCSLFHLHSNIRPCDVRNQLLGSKVGTRQPFNLVQYNVNKKRTITFKVIDVKIGRECDTLNDDIRNRDGDIVAIINSNTQLFLTHTEQSEQSKQLKQSESSRIFCFSPHASTLYFHDINSEVENVLSLRLHDPTVVSIITGKNIFSYKVVILKIFFCLNYFQEKLLL